MFSKLLITIFTILQNQGIQELARTTKESNLSQLITLLSIALILVLAMLTFTLIQKHKLRKENFKLNKQLNQ